MGRSWELFLVRFFLVISVLQRLSAGVPRSRGPYARPKPREYIKCSPAQGFRVLRSGFRLSV